MGGRSDDTLQDQVAGDRPFGNRGDNHDTVNCGPGRAFFDTGPGDKVDLSTCEKPF